MDGLELLKTIQDKTINLIITDPPYIISKNSGMEKFKQDIKSEKKMNKTENDWNNYKIKHHLTTDEFKENFLQYGNTSGKKYSISTNFGKWDSEFTMEILEQFIKVEPDWRSKLLKLKEFGYRED